MKPPRFGLLALLGASALLISACATDSKPPAAGSAAGPGGQPAAVSGQVASGTFGDTLKACMARIPKDATSGQRMLAEVTCQRDEEGRQAIEAVPGAK